ncbi:ABC transporter substrate-binding protein [Primorskyibacter flagellatus]|uniref:Carbohydrate ABC transporter substrate-binding protein, CUT1 family n=1 Tax=Primorskyibacter flagellatus TaxID=1387277 RepID=A0A1W2EA36_9RHOB|nr:extracellular solute-binding protein [Primorskyibacter flagellatus]SMD06614.1 carbohydrate ABC transporter substrate-binding protein, CUT1 family [Primorskyibacter flagellatus]
MNSAKGAKRRKFRTSALAATCLATAFSAPVIAQEESILGGETIRIIGIGDPVFQAMQKFHGEMEEMTGGTIQLDVRPFDVLRQQVLLNAQNSTSSYDIIAVDLPQFGEYKPFLTDLDGFIDATGYDGSDFHDVAWSGAQFGGAQLGIPLQPHPEIFAYRTDIFEKYGLDAPTTHEKVLAAARTISEQEDGMSGVCWNAARGTALGQTFIMDMGDFGAAPIDMVKEGDDYLMGDIQPANMKPMIDTEAGKATADYLQALMEVSPPGILNMAWDERVRVYGQGGCAMTYIWAGRSAIFEQDEASPARGNTAYLPHPSGPDSPPKSTLGGWYLAIPNNIDPDRAELAWKTIEWLASPEMIEEYTKYGNCVSPRSSVSKIDSVIERCPVIPHVEDMSIKGELAGWQRPPVPEVQIIVDVLGAEMHQVISGEKPSEEALSDAQSQLDREMRKAGYY